MNPDLDRLVAAAENAYQDARLPNEVLSQRTAQAIVRAVLTELGKVSSEMREAADRYSWEDNGWRREPWEDEHHSMLKAILAEPATA